MGGGFIYIPPAGEFGLGGPISRGPAPEVSMLIWQINNATGTAGPTTFPTVSGWSLIQSIPNANGTRHGDFYWDASPTNKLSFTMEVLLNPTTIGNDVIGPMANFNPTQSYTWSLVTFAGSYLTQDTTDYPSGPPTSAAALDAATIFDFSGFVNLTTAQIADLNAPGNPTLGWNLTVNSPAGTGGHLDLVYTPAAVPEPGTLALTVLGLAGVWRCRSSRRLASRERKRPEFKSRY
jgi:hypothetical protein